MGYLSKEDEIYRAFMKEHFIATDEVYFILAK